MGGFWAWWTADRVTATCAILALITAVLTALAAFKAVTANRHATQRTTRPMMTACLRISGEASASLVVTNAGQSIARQVDVTFDPPLPVHETSPGDGQPSLITLVVRRYSQTVDAWTPGYVATSEFLMGPGERDEHGRTTNVDEIPRHQAILFTYTDDDGHRYRDRFSLDPTLIEGETWTVIERHRDGEKKIILDTSPWLMKS